MNLSKIFKLITTSAIVYLCAQNAIAAIKTRNSVREIKRNQRKMNKDLAEIKSSLKNRSSEGFVTAFRVYADENVADLAENSFVAEADKVESYEPEYYTLREHEGIVGIFDDEEELVEKINTAVSSLSASDRQSLLLGIKAQNQEEIEKILESLN